MPQREPLSAPLLGALLALAGVASGWLVLALESLAQGGAGAVVGFPWQAVSIEPPFGLPLVRQHLEGSHGPWSWGVFLLSGPLVVLLAGTAAHFLAEAVRAPGWVRALGFEMFALAWLRIPLLALAGGVPGGRGPLPALYERLGEPESGRWAAVVLGVVFLWGAAAFVAWRAVALGREWLRVDGLAFRRRLVRLVAAYPVILATAAYALERPVAPAGWLAAMLALVLAALHLRTN